MKYSLTWYLESIFEGGSHSADLQEKLASIDELLNAYADLNESWDPETDKPAYQKLSD